MRCVGSLNKSHLGRDGKVFLGLFVRGDTGVEKGVHSKIMYAYLLNFIRFFIVCKGGMLKGLLGDGSFMKLRSLEF